MLSLAAQEDLRRSVGLAVEEQGMSQAEGVRVFDVSKTAVHNWRKAYRAEGLLPRTWSICYESIQSPEGAEGDSR